MNRKKKKIMINFICYFLFFLVKTNSKKHIMNRSSRPEVFCKKAVLRNFAKFTGKQHLCHSLFFNKVAHLKAATFLKKRLWNKCFPVNFVKFLRTPFLTKQLQWLLLHQRAKMGPDRCCVVGILIRS